MGDPGVQSSQLGILVAGGETISGAERVGGQLGWLAGWRGDSNLVWRCGAAAASSVRLLEAAVVCSSY